uniref:Alternative protein EEF2K n=1 Tax=Homo sapiens TaxID=9606 RepID=L8E8G5_HUMAN|nr:alternative protein EEF2K [Homo sapiens]
MAASPPELAMMVILMGTATMRKVTSSAPSRMTQARTRMSIPRLISTTAT